jgi:vacuolar-type H+-ATPase subunit E/Vma4
MTTESRTDLLIDKIRKDTDEEVRAIVEKAEKIRQDRNKAQDSLEKREEKAWQRKEELFGQELEERLESSFRMERKKYSLQSREKIMLRIEEEAMHRIENGMSDPLYRDFLKNWIIEGILGLREKNIILKGSVHDLEKMDDVLLKEICSEVLERTGLNVTLQRYSGSPELVPGVLLESSDGRVSFNNQLPARFRRMKAQIRRVINSALNIEAEKHE